jgi:hypothetical protein
MPKEKAAGRKLVAPWTQQREETIVVGHRTLVRRTYEMPDGTIADFEIKVEPAIVCVLARPSICKRIA